MTDYTESEDAIILTATEHGDLRKIAERLGRSYRGILTRSSYLQRRQRALTSPPPEPEPPKQPEPLARVQRHGVFARPAWFTEEDLGIIARRRR
jgi:hypothetical protein